MQLYVSLLPATPPPNTHHTNPLNAEHAGGTLARRNHVPGEAQAASASAAAVRNAGTAAAAAAARPTATITDTLASVTNPSHPVRRAAETCSLATLHSVHIHFDSCNLFMHASRRQNPGGHTLCVIATQTPPVGAHKTSLCPTGSTPPLHQPPSHHSFTHPAPWKLLPRVLLTAC